MIRQLTLVSILTLCCGFTSTADDKGTANDKGTAIDFKMKTIEGKQISLQKKYGGRVILFVNVASQCGLTSQYSELQTLHKKYAAKGLSVVGVPCNQFGSQEPGSNKEILGFCKKNYQVTFDMLAKVNVNGADACKLYKYLTSAETKPVGKGPVVWNFEKFIVDRSGKVVARFDSNVEPNNEELIKVIEDELKQK